MGLMRSASELLFLATLGQSVVCAHVSSPAASPDSFPVIDGAVTASPELERVSVRSS